jgi:hypothetical protein
MEDTPLQIREAKALGVAWRPEQEPPCVVKLQDN